MAGSNLPEQRALNTPTGLSVRTFAKQYDVNTVSSFLHALISGSKKREPNADAKNWAVVELPGFTADWPF